MTFIILQFCVAIYSISVAFGEISVHDLKISIVTPNSLARPEFEAGLSQALQTDSSEKNFSAQEEAAIGANAIAAGIAVWVSFTPAAPLASLAAILPIVQMALSKESDFKEPLVRVIADNNVRPFIDRDLDDIENYSKRIFRTIKELNDYLKDPNGRNADGRAYMIAKIEGIQHDLEDIIRIFLNGNSGFWKYPQLAATPLLGLSVLISEFAPVRDSLLNNQFDESIISCLMQETLQRYTPKILRWRLYQIGLGTHLDTFIVGKIRTVFDHPDLIFNGDRDYFSKHPFIPCYVRDCDRNAESYSCFIDKIQGEAFAEDYPQRNNYGCLYSYLMLVRSSVEKTFGNAINLMQNTCHRNMDVGQQNTNRYGWWSFEHLNAITIDALTEDGLGICNLLTRDCSPHFKIYINEQVVLDRVFNHVRSFDIEGYRSRKIPRTSLVRFEMWVEFVYQLNQTRSIQELTERPHLFISEPGTHNIITLEHSEWQDDFNN